MTQEQKEAGEMKRAGIVASLIWTTAQAGLAYWIHKNYWEKSGWGKFGTVWFGLGAVYNLSALAGLVATPTEVLAKLNSKKEEQTSNELERG